LSLTPGTSGRPVGKRSALDAELVANELRCLGRQIELAERRVAGGSGANPPLDDLDLSVRQRRLALRRHEGRVRRRQRDSRHELAALRRAGVYDAAGLAAAHDALVARQ